MIGRRTVDAEPSRPGGWCDSPASCAGGPNVGLGCSKTKGDATEQSGVEIAVSSGGCNGECSFCDHPIVGRRRGSMASDQARALVISVPLQCPIPVNLSTKARDGGLTCRGRRDPAMPSRRRASHYAFRAACWREKRSRTRASILGPIRDLTAGEDGKDHRRIGGRI